MSFSPGDKVVCVDASIGPSGEPNALIEGRTYTIRSIACDGDPSSARVHLAEIASPDFVCIMIARRVNGWNPSRFRLAHARTTDISVFEEILVGTRRVELVD